MQAPWGRRPAAVLCLGLGFLVAVPTCKRHGDDVPPLPTAERGGYRIAPRTTLIAEPVSPPRAPRAKAHLKPPIPKAPPKLPPAPVTPFPIRIPVLPAMPGFPLWPAPVSAAGDSGRAQPIPDSRVIVYGTSWCGHCARLKKELTARGIPYVFIDLEDKRALASPAGAHAREMPPEMRKGVPVTRVVQKNGRPMWISGENPEGVERAYRGA